MTGCEHHANARTGFARAELVRILLADERVKRLRDETDSHRRSVPGYMLSEEEQRAWRDDPNAMPKWLADHLGLMRDVQEQTAAIIEIDPRTALASVVGSLPRPLSDAAAAVAGHFVDVRKWEYK